MKSTIFVTGHRAPDADSIASAMGYCHLKQKQGESHYVAARLGAFNTETAFILDHLGFEEARRPMLLHTLRRQVRDIAYDPTPTVAETATLREAWSWMRRTAVKSLPIVSPAGELRGMLTAGDLVEREFERAELMHDESLRTSVSNLIATLSGRLLSGEAAREITARRIRILLDTTDDPKEAIAVCGRDAMQQSRALQAPCACLVACDPSLSQDILRVAEARGIPVIQTPYAVFEAAHLAAQSRPVSALMMNRSEILHFGVDDYVDDVRDIMLKTRYRSYPVIDRRGVVIGSLSRIHVIKPASKLVVLVDHNETAQSVPGIDQAEIVEIIDHHRLGDVQTAAPIRFRSEPVGATATIISSMFREGGLAPDPDYAQLLCAAILSDTVLFRSPTCTQKDRDTAAWLAEVGGFDAEKLGFTIFERTLSVDSLTPEQIVRQDYKTFTLLGRKLGVGQVSALDFGAVSLDREALLECMKGIAEREGYDLVALMLTDILKGGSELLYAGRETQLVEDAFGSAAQPGMLFLPGVMSRKKQVIPNLSAVMT